MTAPTAQEEPVSVTAGEEDHTNPWALAGVDADAPENPDVVRTAGVPSWRNCVASLTLVAAINARYPNRDKASDGTIGDAAHATRVSDHNPWVKDSSGMGVVRARDVDKDGLDAAWIVEELRKLGAAGDPRLRNEGYVIFNRRITKPDFSGWSVYTGTNPHDHHFHTSFSLDQAGYDSDAPWVFLDAAAPAPQPAPAPAPTPPPAPVIPPVPGLPGWSLPRGHYYGIITGPSTSHGGYFANERPAIQAAQRRLIAKGYVPGVTDWRSSWADGRFEQPTKDAVVRFQRAEMPGTRFFGQLWADDWARLAR